MYCFFVFSNICYVLSQYFGFTLTNMTFLLSFHFNITFYFNITWPQKNHNVGTIVLQWNDSWWFPKMHLQRCIPPSINTFPILFKRLHRIFQKYISKYTWKCISRQYFIQYGVDLKNKAWYGMILGAFRDIQTLKQHFWIFRGRVMHI